MTIVPLKILPFCLGSLFVILTVGASRPMLSLYAHDLGASMIEIGFLSACYSILPMLFAVSVGGVVDRLGSKLPTFFGSLGMAMAMFFPFLFPSIIGLTFSQLLLGISHLTIVIAQQNGVGQSSSKEDRDRNVANFSLFGSLGMMLGPVMGGYLSEHSGFQWTFFYLGWIALVPILFEMLFKMQPPRQKVEKKQGLGLKVQITLVKEALKNPIMRGSVIVSMFVLSSLDIFRVYFPLHAQVLGFSASQIGLLLFGQGIAAIVIRIFMTPAIARIGHIHMLWLSLVIGAVAFGGLTFLQTFTLLFAACFLLGIGLGVCQPLTMVLTYNAAEKGRTGEALAVRLAGNRLGQITIPFILAAFSQIIGLGSIFIIQSIVLFGGAWLSNGMNQTLKKELRNSSSTPPNNV